MVKTALESSPREAPVALVRVKFMVSFGSSIVSVVIGMVKVLLLETPSAQFRVPELKV